MKLTSLAFLILAAPAVAETAMTAEEFEAYSTGKTLTFGQLGQPYGAEQYLPNRRVRWSYLDGQCKEGRWFEDLELICFVYDDDPVAQCWSFFETPNGLEARYENDPEDVSLYVAQESIEPLMCIGPDVGV